MLKDSVYLGLNTHFYLRLSSGDAVEVIKESVLDDTLHPGDSVILTLKEEKINIFSREDRATLIREGV